MVWWSSILAKEGSVHHCQQQAPEIGSCAASDSSELDPSGVRRATDVAHALFRRGVEDRDFSQ